MIPTIFSCGTVVYKKQADQTHILLVKQFKNDTGWGIPKGRMEAGETYTETAVRETQEETGVDVQIITQLPHVTIIRKNYKKVVVPFLAIQLGDDEPVCDHKNSEVADVKWFDLHALPEIYNYQRPIIDAAFLLLKS
jgi:ADP-ribose pyrophosphatase YjhB (NUDIX family)